MQCGRLPKAPLVIATGPTRISIPQRARALPTRRSAAPRDRVRRVRVAVRVAPRPVLAGDRQLALDALEVRLQVAVGDRPVGADAVARPRLEVGGMEARRVAGEVRSSSRRRRRPELFLPSSTGSLAADDARAPSSRGRATPASSRDPVAVRVPERARSRGRRSASRARASRCASAPPPAPQPTIDQVDLVVVAVARHPVEVLERRAGAGRAGTPSRCPRHASEPLSGAPHVEPRSPHVADRVDARTPRALPRLARARLPSRA